MGLNESNSGRGYGSQGQPGLGYLIEDLLLLFFKLQFVFPVQPLLFASSIPVFCMIIYRRGKRRKCVNVEEEEGGYKIDI